MHTAAGMLAADADEDRGQPETQINYFDPDGTRIKIMATTNVDGKPAPASEAPTPHFYP